MRRRRTRHRRNGEPLMQWSNEDDTSEKDNPLYIKRAKVHLAFGRGYVAGVDVRQQRKDSEYMKSLLAIRSQAEQDKMVPISYNSEELNRQLIQDMQKNQQEKEEEYVQREGTGHGSHWSEKALEDMTLRDWHIMREDFEIRVQGARSIYPLRFWSEAAVHPAILKAVEILGYKEPTPIQRQAIPIELKGMDMIGIAKTGSGKTCAFVVPMLEYVMQAPLDSRINSKEQGPLAVVMAPTRELAKQIRDDTVQLSQFCVDSRLASIRDPHIRVVCMVGGESIIEQSSFLSNGCDILIGTPGRLLDCLEQHYVVLNQTNYIVLDEADRMIDEGFEDSVNAVLDAMGSILKSEEEEDIEKEAEGVVSLTNKYRTTIMFSATMPPKVEAIAKRYMRCPVQVTIGSSNSTTKIDIKQIINMVRESQKPAMLLKIIRNNETPVIVFCNRKETVDAVVRSLHDSGHRAVALRGGISQDRREEALEDFRRGVYDIMVATNVAARGLDIKGVKLVVNYDMPDSLELYIHRIGRTGRAGAAGLAISLVTEKDSALFPDLVNYLKKEKQQIPVELERHRTVREANQLSKLKEEDEGTVSTEFKMI